MSIPAVTDMVIHYGGLALLHGSVLGCVTWLLCATVLRRSRPAVQAVLWTVVLIKFLLPPVLPGEMALSSWVTQAVTNATASQSLQGEPSRLPGAEPVKTDVEQDTSRVSAKGLAVGLLLICYLLVVTLLSVRALLALRRTRQRLRSLPLANQWIGDEVLALATRIGLKHAPVVRVTNEQVTPYVFGFRGAVLVLPERLVLKLEPQERQALILHELAHVERQDQVIRWIEGLACVLFFFFPPVRWVCRRIEHFTEMACDRWAITVSEIEPQAYAAALVRVVKELHTLPQAQTALPLVRGVRLLEARLRAILGEDTWKSPRLSVVARVVLTVWSIFVWTGGSTAPAHQAMLNLPQGSVKNAEEALSEKPRIENPETREGRAAVPLKRAAGRTGTAHSDGSSTLRQEPVIYPIRDERAKEKVVERTLDERHATEAGQPSSRFRQEQQVLSPYEKGFLLGKQYAEEQARRAQTVPLTNGQVNRYPHPADENSRREIEMRMQALKSRSPRQ
jgi:beta-lactamase regulating signal transducer with metallopeptidase domain